MCPGGLVRATPSSKHILDTARLDATGCIKLGFPNCILNFIRCLLYRGSFYLTLHLYRKPRGDPGGFRSRYWGCRGNRE